MSSSSRKGTPRGFKLKAPEQQQSMSDYLTSSGSFRDGDLIVNRDGLRVGSQETTSSGVVAGSPGTSFSLEDLNTVSVLGKGSGGMVKLVRHTQTGQFLAVKVIQMNIQDDVVRKQIVGELKINQASQCPYVAICHDAYYDNGVISIVFEYMDAGSLADVIRSFGTIPEPCLAAICTQVLRGLMYLHHDRHVIHRDIKPSNLLVNHKGEVKITDFGVSAILTNSLSLRSTFVGTYSYMSPERIIGETYGYDSDIWSLGLTILECAMGKFPYVPPCGRENWLNFYELVDTMAEQPPPCAPPDQFSPEFCSFISGWCSMYSLQSFSFKICSFFCSLLYHLSQCLTAIRLFTCSSIQKQPKDRMSELELLNHPFIRKYEGQSTSLLSSFLQDWSPSA